MIQKVIMPLLKPKNLILIGFVLCIVGIAMACDLNNLALSTLSKVKTITGNDVKLEKIDYSSSKAIDNSAWNTLLKKYVRENGDVDYQGFMNEKNTLETYLEQLSENPPSKTAPRNEQMAYWINAYNAFTIKLIIDNFPVKSIKDIAGNIPMIDSPWDIKFFTISGQIFDLNTIEHEILRKDFNDPRIHFAINCASFSCPKLRNESFEATTLEAQLEEQTKTFINNPSKNNITSNQLQVSSIFDWFKSDFTRNGSLKDFILKYSNIQPSNTTKLVYLDYIWDLNSI